ncbi:hypothetical protein AAFF_G00038310 [Aldrovandia affinis]|uniref:Uncharacterized protein n=1 Tax=Aldrovandia affinis TaxID=143900 RepID=A0AAD7X084_9TELE|nr:hypothetical protein AAFF_G00038310 [Aldrovandia affinis]
METCHRAASASRALMSDGPEPALRTIDSADKLENVVSDEEESIQTDHHAVTAAILSDRGQTRLDAAKGQRSKWWRGAIKVWLMIYNTV